MKIAVTSKGEWISSPFCPDFENCEYLIIYDTLTNQYGSRRSPSFESKEQHSLIEFFRKTLLKNVITGKKVDSDIIKVFIPSSNDITVEEAIIEFLKGR